jgi:hypothetical protein
LDFKKAIDGETKKTHFRFARVEKPGGFGAMGPTGFSLCSTAPPRLEDVRGRGLVHLALRSERQRVDAHVRGGGRGVAAAR